MKKILPLLVLYFCIIDIHAQYTGYPIIYTWVKNLTGAVGYDNIPSNVLSVKYDTSNVYIAADCIPGYDIGPWNSNPNTPSNQDFVYKITRKPVKNTGTLTTIGLGHTGVWSNGVSVYNVSDAMSYNNAGVWYRNAYYFEGISFDSCLGHPAPNGEYHNHVNPICLYEESDSTRHSPIIGYAFDGYPIYGTFGYANADGTGGIKRITSSYVVSTATTRANGPAVSSSYPAGCFLEDWIYTPGAGDLDSLNGRFCVTPEYPNGTYCYYATLGPGEVPTFPYTMYKNYYGVVQAGNTNTGGHNTAPATDSSYTAAYLPGIIISTSTDTICAGTPVTFNATITTGGPSPSYAWFLNGVLVGSGSVYTSSALVNHDTVMCMLTSNAYYLSSNTATSNNIIVTVNPTVTPAVSISASQTTFCAGTSVNFTATPVNGGNAATYQWVKDGNYVGTGTNTYSNNSLNNNDSVWVVMTSNAACANTLSATSNKVKLTVADSVVPSVSISASQTNICAGTSITFTATSSNGGTTPTYQWQKDGNNVGANNATYTDNSLNNNDSVWVFMTSSFGCASPANATSNEVTISVNSSVTPGISISSNPGDIICPGNQVSFTANITQGGNTPAYQWYLNNNQVGTAAVYVDTRPGNGDIINCVLTSDANCASPATANSNAVTITVLNLPAKPIVTQQGNVFTSSATSNNQWLLNGNIIAGAVNQSYTVASDGWYAVEVASDSGCISISDSLYMNLTGLTDITLSQAVNVLPNPFGNHFEIHISNGVKNSGPYKYQLADCLARVVSEHNIDGVNQVVETSNLAAGIYLLTIFGPAEKAGFKVVKTD